MNLDHCKFNGFEAARQRKARVCTYRNPKERTAWFAGYDDYEDRAERFAKSPVQDFLANAARDRVMGELKELLK